MSTLPSAVQSATAAIQRGIGGFNRDAAVVASSSIAESADVLPALIDSRQQLLYVQAAAKMIDTADKMLGSLVDTHA